MQRVRDALVVDRSIVVSRRERRADDALGLGRARLAVRLVLHARRLRLGAEQDPFGQAGETGDVEAAESGKVALRERTRATTWQRRRSLAVRQLGSTRRSQRGCRAKRRSTRKAQPVQKARRTLVREHNLSVRCPRQICLSSADALMRSCSMNDMWNADECSSRRVAAASCG